MAVELAPMPCQELVEVLTAYLDGSLPAGDAARLRAHLALCDACVAYIAQFEATIERCGHVGAGDLDPAAREDLMRVFAGWRGDG